MIVVVAQFSSIFYCFSQCSRVAYCFNTVIPHELCAVSGNSTDAARRHWVYITLEHLLSASHMQPDSDKPRLLDVIDIPEPCQVPWDTMTGDERIRHCGMCKKNVYNISEMSTSEAEKFLQEKLGSACIGFTRRADGTITTDTCPKILKPVRNGFRRLKKAVAIVIGAIMSVSASFAQGESSSTLTKEQCAALAEGRFKVLASEPRGIMTRGFVFSHNVYKIEAARNPAGYGGVITPKMSINDFASGDFALKIDSEIYEENGKLFINEEERPRTVSKRAEGFTTHSLACIDGCTPSWMFKRGKVWVEKHNDRIAERFFKASLKMLMRLRTEPEPEIQKIIHKYADLLKRNGRTKEAKRLLESDVAKNRESHGKHPKGMAALGLDPAMLSVKPQPRKPPVVRNTKPIQSEPFVNPFAPIPNLPQGQETKKQRSTK